MSDTINPIMLTKTARMEYVPNVEAEMIEAVARENRELKERLTEKVSVAVAYKPVWNAARSELSFRGMVVRTVRRTAKAPLAILAEFQSVDWPERLDNPLSPGQSLSEAVRTLNRGLKGLRFRRDGGGEDAGGILWEVVD